MPIQVECHACGSRLRASDSSVGKSLKCPKCSGEVKVPPVLPNPLLTTPANSAENKPAGSLRKKCPFCAEEIAAEAIKCRYCMSELPAIDHPQASNSKKLESENPVETEMSKDILNTNLPPEIGRMLRDGITVFTVGWLLAPFLAIWVPLVENTAGTIKIGNAVFGFLSVLVSAVCFGLAGAIVPSFRLRHLAGAAAVVLLFALIFAASGFPFFPWFITLIVVFVPMGLGYGISFLLNKYAHIGESARDLEIEQPQRITTAKDRSTGSPIFRMIWHGIAIQGGLVLIHVLVGVALAFDGNASAALSILPVFPVLVFVCMASGFALSACAVSGRRWDHLGGVAAVFWLLGFTNCIFFGVPISQWLLSLVFVLIAMAMGGGLANLLTGESATKSGI